MKELYHIFAYIKKHHNAEMVFDPTRVILMRLCLIAKIGPTPYGYEELKEILPDIMPKPCEPDFPMCVYVDADHAGDLATCKLRTGFVIFLNGALIYWNSKRQNSMGTSTFGAKFYAMKVVTEYV